MSSYNKFKLLALLLLGLSPGIYTETYSCKSEQDCLSYFKCIKNQCIHKDFFPISLIQFIEIFVMACFSAISTSVGVGGGAIYSTILMLIENFDASKAFPISNFIILLCSLSVFFLGAKMQQQEEIPDHQFVDYNLVLAFCPMLLLGTKFGVILNKMTPSIVLTFLLVLTVGFSCIKTYKK